MLTLCSAAQWRREALRTNLWFVPLLEVIGAVLLYVATHAVDSAAFHHNLSLPRWLIFGSRTRRGRS